MDIQDKYKKIISDFKTYYTDAENFKAVWEVKAYVWENFYEWHHRIVFNTETNSMEYVPQTTDRYTQIDKVKKFVRWIKNKITKNDPRWHPTWTSKKPISEEEKNICSAILQWVYKEEHMKDKIKDLLVHSLTKTIAWLFVWYDSSKKDIDLFVEDPFNIYTSPDWKLEWPVFVGKYIIRTFRKSISDIKNSSIYNQWDFKENVEKIEASSRFASSEQKNNILQNEYTIPVDKNGSCIIKELYIMDSWESETEIKDNLSSQENINRWTQRVRIITMVEDIIIRDELTEYEHFPFLAYQPERNKWLLYHNSWISSIIPLNRWLNDIFSNRADWIEKFSKGRYIVPKWSKMSVIKWTNGQIIEFTWWKPVIEDVKSMGTDIDKQYAIINELMQDLWWLHSESMGASSNNDASWVAIAQLQAADNNNVAEPVDNLKTFLEEVAYRILTLASKFYDEREIDTDIWPQMVAWQNVKVGDNVFKIKPLKNIEVEIIPWSAFSDLQTRMDLVELRKIGVAIPDSLIIDSYKLWNTGKIINEYEAEQQRQQENADWMEALEWKQAELENQKLLQGVEVFAQESENHQIHLAIHSQSLEWIKENEPWAQLLIRHMEEHKSFFDPNNEVVNTQNT